MVNYGNWIDRYGVNHISADNKSILPAIIFEEEDIMANNICPKCGSTNVNFQREQTASVGGSLHSFGGGKKGHGIIYWIFIGCWWVPIKWMCKWIMAISTLGISLLFTRKKKDKISGKTVTASKSINRTMAVCQNCGNSWKA